MPLRGENVGTAYVRILADGSDLDDSIRQSLEDAGPAIEGEGRRGSKEYTEAFAEQQESAPSRKRLRESIAKSLAEIDFAKTFTNSPGFREFRRSLETRFGEAGRVAGTNLERGLLTGAGFEDFQARIGNLTREIERATSQIMSAEEKQRAEMLSEALRMNAAFDRARLDQQRDMLAEAYRLNREYDARERARTEQMDADFEQHVRARQDGVERIRAVYGRLVEQVDAMERGEKSAFGQRGRIIAQFEQLRSLMVSAGDSTDEWNRSLDRNERRIRLMHPGLNRFNRQIEDIADSVGRASGRGSRNNFLNFIGGMASGLVRLLKVGPNVLGFFRQMAVQASIAFSEVTRNGGSTFRATMAGVEAGFITAASAAGPFVAVIAALALLVGPLVALLGGLVGILTALTSTITFGLLGGLSALAGLLAPLAAGIGVTVAAFLGLDDAQKKVLKNDMKPVVNAFKSLADIAAEGVFSNLREQAQKFAPVVAGLEPLVRRVSEAISDVADGWVASLNSPGFNNFRDEFAVVLPGMVRRLGRIFGNTIGGIGGIFVAMIPLIQRFLGWLDRITQNFNEWANSQAGREELERFFERAGDSAAALGDFLKQALDFFSELLSAGKDTGDSMFRSMADGLNGIADFFRENPDALAQFFEDSERLFDSLGDLGEALVALIDDIDNLYSRLAANGIVQAFALLISGIAVGMRVTGRVIEQRFIQPLGAAIEILRRLSGWVANINFTALGQRMGEAVARVVTAVSSGFNRARSFVQSRIADMGVFIARLPGRITGLLAGVGGIFRAAFSRAVTSVGTAFTSMVASASRLPGRIGSALAGIRGYIAERFNEAVAYVAGIPGRIADLFAGLAGRILRAIGTIDIGSLIKVPNPGSGVPFVPGLASGGTFGRITNGPMLRWVGEDGPEAIVPLDRDLSRVDPAVRALSAIAQGKVAGMASGGVSTGRTLDASGWTIVSNSEDSRTVAREVLDRLVGSAIFA